MISDSDLKKLLALSRLEVPASAVAKLREDLSQILDYASCLHRLDLSPYEPLVHPHEMAGPTRADEPQEVLGEAALGRNPVEVPRVVE